MEKEKVAQIKDFLIEKLSPTLIVLFGSAAKGTDRANSDIDVAFLSKNHVDVYETFMVAQELASLLNKDVDLVDLRKASTVFQFQIISAGQTIYSSNENERMSYEMKTYKMYAKLNEERQNLLEKVEESGSVYEE